MLLALAHAYKATFTSKLPLAHYMRWATYAWALLFIAIDVVFGKTAQLIEVFVGQIVVCYLIVGTLGELYYHRTIIKDDAVAKDKRYKQSLQEIIVAVEALVGVCAFSCCAYELVDPIFNPHFGYFANPILGTPGQHAYTVGWGLANVAFYLVFCDGWFWWWHYAFHQFEALWPMHYQHHQLREPTSFGGPTVHVVELILEYTIAHHLTSYLMPFHVVTHRALGVFAFIAGAVWNHGGLTLDYNDHYAHHITWKGGRGKYCNCASRLEPPTLRAVALAPSDRPWRCRARSHARRRHVFPLLGLDNGHTLQRHRTTRLGGQTEG